MVRFCGQFIKVMKLLVLKCRLNYLGLLICNFIDKAEKW